MQRIGRPVVSAQLCQITTQVFKIPIAGWIEEEPMSLLYALAGSTSVLMSAFAVSIVLARDFRSLDAMATIGEKEEEERVNDPEKKKKMMRIAA